jgi:hypothetical protein
MGRKAGTAGHSKNHNSIASAAKKVSEEPIEELVGEG